MKQAAAERHEVLRARIKAAFLETLADGPMGSKRLHDVVHQRVPEATDGQITAVRAHLMGKTGQIEYRSKKVCLSGVDRSKPITALEKEVVASLGSGKTAKEVAADCELVRSATSARTILSALAQRGVISRHPDIQPPVYQALDEMAAAA